MVTTVIQNTFRAARAKALGYSSRTVWFRGEGRGGRLTTVNPGAAADEIEFTPEVIKKHAQHSEAMESKGARSRADVVYLSQNPGMAESFGAGQARGTLTAPEVIALEDAGYEVMEFSTSTPMGQRIVPTLIDERNVFDWADRGQVHTVAQQIAFNQHGENFDDWLAMRNATREDFTPEKLEQLQLEWFDDFQETYERYRDGLLNSEGIWTTLEEPAVLEATARHFDGFYVKEAATDEFLNVGMFGDKKIRSMFAEFSLTPDQRRGINMGLATLIGGGAVAGVVEEVQAGEIEPSDTTLADKVAKAIEAGASMEDIENVLSRYDISLPDVGVTEQQPVSVTTTQAPRTQQFSEQPPAPAFEDPAVDFSVEGIPEVASNLAANIALPDLLVDGQQAQSLYEQMQEEYIADPEGFRNRFVQQRAEAATQEITEVIPEAEPEEAAQLLEEERQALTSPIAMERAIVRENYPGLPPESEAQLAANIAMYRILNEVIEAGEQQGTWSKVADYAGFLVPDLNWDLAQADVSADTIRQFQLLSPEDQVLMFRALAQELMESQDQNELKVANTLSKFLSQAGAEELETEQIWDAVGVALTALDVPALFALRGLKKGADASKAVSTAAKAGDTATAGTANALAVGSDQFATSVGMTRDEAFMNGTVFPNEELLGPGFADGIQNETQAALTGQTLETVRELRRNLMETLDQDFTLRAGELYDPDKVKTALRERTKEFREQLRAEYEGTGAEIGGYTAIIDNDGSYTIRVPVQGADTEFREQVWKPGLNEVGEFQFSVVDNIGAGLTSPKHYLSDPSNPGRTINNLVENFEIAVSTRERLRFRFNEAWKTALKPIRGRNFSKKKEQLDAVLQQGDELDQRYTIQELQTGIDTPLGRIVLDDDQITSYYAMLDISDFLDLSRNMIVREGMEARGIRHIKFGDGDHYGKPVDTLPDNVSEIYNAADGQIYRVDELPELEGQVIVRLDENVPVIRDGEKQYFGYAVVDETAVGDLPHWVVNSRAAYVPKINKNVNYAVRATRPARVNGQMVEDGDQYVERLFETRAEADAFAAEMNATGEAGVSYKVYDEADIRFRGDTEIRRKSGLYFGARSSREVLMGVGEGTPVERMPASAAIHRNLSFLANRMPVNEMRMAVQQRFINTVNNTDGLAKIREFNDPLVGPADTVARLERIRNYVNGQLRVPTKEEQVFSAAMRRTAEWMEGRLPSGMRRTVMNLKDTDPVGWVRASAFHAYLGWFNFSQLIVQAAGASIALSRFPQHGIGAFRDYLAMRAALFAPDDAAVRKMAKAGGYDPDEFTTLLSEFRKTGLGDSLKSTADHNAAIQGYGTATQTYRDLADKGLVFFKEGEQLNRMVSYSVAYRRWKAANNGRKPSKPEHWREIFKDQQNLSLNMSLANTAEWQTGLKSVPTQFLQVQTKFLESVFGGSRAVGGSAQRFRLFLGQMAIFGYVGLPFGNTLLKQTVSSLQDFGIDPNQWDDEAWAWMEQGIFGLYTDNQLEGASRGALAKDIERMVVGLFEEEYNLAGLLFGAFGGLVGRGNEALRTMGMFFNDDVPTEAAVVATVDRLASIVSSYRNAETAIYDMWLMDRYVSKRGIILADDFTPTEIIGQAAGFSPRRFTEFYEFLSDDRKLNEVLEEKAGQIIRDAELFFKYSQDDPKTSEAYWNYVTTYINAMGDVNPSHRAQLLQKIGDRLSDPETAFERAMFQAIERASEEVANDLHEGRMLRRFMQGQEMETENGD